MGRKILYSFSSIFFAFWNRSFLTTRCLSVSKSEIATQIIVSRELSLTRKCGGMASHNGEVRATFSDFLFIKMLPAVAVWLLAELLRLSAEIEISNLSLRTCHRWDFYDLYRARRRCPRSRFLFSCFGLFLFVFVERRHFFLLQVQAISHNGGTMLYFSHWLSGPWAWMPFSI